MMMLLHRLAKALKKTIFLSTHDLEHALQIADQIWLLDERQGLVTGIPEDLCRVGAIETYFQRDGLKFDPNTCTFNIRHEVAREVLVEGDADSLPYKMLCRALQRNAILPVRSMDEAQMESTRSDVLIRVTKAGNYQLVDKGEVTVDADHIEHILSVTNSTIVKNHIQTVRDEAQMTNFE